MIKFIDDLAKIERGEQFYQDKTGKLRIVCQQMCSYEEIKVYDFKTNLVYYKHISLDIPAHYEFRHIIKNHDIKNVYDLIEVLAFDIKENFKCKKFVKSDVFNPFIKTLSGKLEIKSKTGRFTKAQVKKILCHEDTEVSIEGVYTDDYAWDNAVNFQRGKKMNRIDMLEEVFKYFHHATTFKNESRTFGVYTGGYSTLTEIKNKNIVLV